VKNGEHLRMTVNVRKRMLPKIEITRDQPNCRFPATESRSPASPWVLHFWADVPILVALPPAGE
jgi:hypothetical protein